LGFQTLYIHLIARCQYLISLFVVYELSCNVVYYFVTLQKQENVLWRGLYSMRKKIVMQDIADKLNISKNSVSQALSGKAGVSEETRRNIIQTTEEMGYRYTRKKSNPANNQVKSIGLIASEQAFSLKSFFGEIYLSIEREAQRHDIRLVIQSITPHDKDQFRLPDFVKERNVDGILILSHMSTAYINKIIAQGIPTVL